MQTATKEPRTSDSPMNIHVELFNQLKQVLETEKCFLDANLTLGSLAIKLHTNRQYLSTTIHHYFGENYIDCINKYRINESTQIIEAISKGKFKNCTMLKVANISGFKSTSTFNPAFKKVTGMKPSEYKRKLNRQRIKNELN